MNPSSETRVSLAIPNKGRLAESTRSLLHRAGIKFETGTDRQLVGTAWNGRLRILAVRAADIPEFVEDGTVDLGITGHDLVAESGKRVDELLDLGFGQCRLVVAVPERSRIRDLDGIPAGATVATSFPRLTSEHFRSKKKDIRIVGVSGAAEAAPHLGLADVIADLTASGTTLAMNDLIEIDEILTSTARLVANPASAHAPGKTAIVQDVEFALRTVVAARGKRYLMMDVPADAVEEVAKIVPGIAGPTVMEVAGNPGMRAVHVVVDEERVYEAMRKLKALGATGILLVPVDRMVA